jgi:uncharacterized protein
MKLDISELLHAPTEAEYSVDQPCPTGLGVQCESKVTGHLDFQSTSNLLVIRGDVCADLVIECARCLEPVRYPVRAEIEEEFRLEHSQIVAEGDQADTEGLDENLLAIFKDSNLDLDEFLRQHLLLAIPPYPICSEECKGLCPRCGVNLNRGECVCTEKDLEESPFADLARKYQVNGTGSDDVTRDRDQ